MSLDCNQIALQDIPALDVTFDFGTHVKRSPATPAFVLAFEAACSVGRHVVVRAYLRTKLAMK